MKIALLILRNAYADRVKGLDDLVREWNENPGLRPMLDQQGIQTRAEMDEITHAIRALSAMSPGTIGTPLETMEGGEAAPPADAGPHKKAGRDT